MDQYRTKLLSALARITEISAIDADVAGATVIDIREPHELAVGMLPGAVRLRMSDLAQGIAAVAPDPEARIVVYCAVGERSAIAAAMLEDLGYTDVASLRGGIQLWMAADRPTVAASSLSSAQRRRYARQLVLPGVGIEGQQRLIAASVAIVGAGGLGSPAAMYLAAAGVGKLSLIDHDAVELSNLQRQLLHGTGDVGRPKTDSAAERIQSINPGVAVVRYQTRLDSDNALEILAGHDVIVDGTDNFATRYLINDASLRLHIPVVHGSVFRFEGQVSVFHPYVGPCYRCLFPEPPPADLAPNCAEAGVFGAVPGVIGALQATEAIKLVVGVGDPLVGEMVTYDGLEQSIHKVRFSRDPQCESCRDEDDPPALRDHAEYC